MAREPFDPFAIKNIKAAMLTHSAADGNRLTAEEIADLAPVREENAQLSKDNEQLSVDNAKLRAENQAAQDARAAEKAQHATDLANAAEMRKSLTAQKNQNTAHAATIKTLQANNTRVLAAHEALRVEYNEVFEQELRSVQTDLAAALVELEGAKEARAAAEQRAKDMEQRAKDMEKQLRDARELTDVYREKSRKRTREEGENDVNNEDGQPAEAARVP
jgi:hypothetical protein